MVIHILCYQQKLRHNGELSVNEANDLFKTAKEGSVNTEDISVMTLSTHRSALSQLMAHKSFQNKLHTLTQ